MMTTKQRKRRGFTMVELLTVIGVIAVLLALMLPAIQQAQLDARQTYCRNNLKEIGLAFHNYHDAFGIFPFGWNNHHAMAGPAGRIGWEVSILPYLDEAPLYNAIYNDTKFGNMLPASSDLYKKRLKVYRCPADPTPDFNPLRGNYGTSNYSGNFGPDAPLRWLPGTMSQWWPGQPPTRGRTNGVLWLNSNMRIRDITDGMSNTFLVGERSVTSGAGIWVGVRGNEFENDQVTDCSPGNEINSGFAAFSSRHSGGANFLFADGRVRFISERIDSRAGTGKAMGTYQKLSNRHDKQNVGKF